MKRTFTLIVLLFAFALGSAQAQNWFGVRIGYPLGVTVHYGIEDALSANLDLRVSANFRIRDNNVNFGVGVDALNTVSIEPPFEVYVGGGAAIEVGGSSPAIELHGLAGGEFRFTDAGLDPLGVFAELTLGVGFGGGRSFGPRFGGALGVNWHF